MGYRRGSVHWTLNQMKDRTTKIRDTARGYKGILHNCVVRRFLDYDYKTNKVSYKKKVEFVSSSVKGKKHKHFFDDHLSEGYYVLTKTRPHHQHAHTVSTYELTEAGEDLFAILDL